MLTDNGAIFTAESRRGACAIELELIALGIDYKHSRPYNPQTCGKVERFHQTLKRWLAKQRRAATVAGLQAQLDRFKTYYNTIRPHRALDRRTPVQAFAAEGVSRRPGPGARAPPASTLPAHRKRLGTLRDPRGLSSIAEVIHGLELPTLSDESFIERTGIIRRARHQRGEMHLARNAAPGRRDRWSDRVPEPKPPSDRPNRPSSR